MRFINYIVLIAILGLSAIMPGGCSKDPKGPEVKLTVLNSMERIGQNQELFGENQASIKASKNEVESFQVVVGAIRKNIRVTGAEISDHTGKAGIISEQLTGYFPDFMVLNRIPRNPLKLNYATAG